MICLSWAEIVPGLDPAGVGNLALQRLCGTTLILLLPISRVIEQVLRVGRGHQDFANAD